MARTKKLVPEEDDVLTLEALTTDLSITDIVHHATEMLDMAEDLRNRILAPKPRKAAPTFTSTQLADLCGIDRARVNYLVTKPDSGLPVGTLNASGRVREFTLPEVYQWVAAERKLPQRPADVAGRTLLVANFKGGSTKTTTAMCLAQGLSLRGRKVLLVDLDPQGSLTELCGFYADMEIKHEDTLAPYLASYLGDEPLADAGYAVRPTYWPGVDLIPASSELFNADFNFPGIMRRHPNIPIWTLLERGLQALKADYDYIVIDTAPSLSYLTVNGMMAADGIIMPLVPESLDFISSIQFWKLFRDLAEVFQQRDDTKKFDFVSVLLSKVNSATSSSAVVRQWASMAYQTWMLPVEIPLSAAAGNGALRFNTVYDGTVAGDDYGRKTMERLRGPFDQLCELIDKHYEKKWGAL